MKNATIKSISQFLWQKLTAQNISTKIINAIKAMYSTVRSVVKNNNELPDILYSHQGAKQGDCGSSLMFMMFLNDILNNINSNIDNIFSINEIKFISNTLCRRSSFICDFTRRVTIYAKRH